MKYDKPKVTIDLDEYLELKQRGEKGMANKYLEAAQKIVFELMNNSHNLRQGLDNLHKQGITILRTDDSATGTIAHKSISIIFGKK